MPAIKNDLLVLCRGQVVTDPSGQPRCHAQGPTTWTKPGIWVPGTPVCHTGPEQAFVTPQQWLDATTLPGQPKRVWVGVRIPSSHWGDGKVSLVYQLEPVR